MRVARVDAGLERCVRHARAGAAFGLRGRARIAVGGAVVYFVARVAIARIALSHFAGPFFIARIALACFSGWVAVARIVLARWR